MAALNFKWETDARVENLPDTFFKMEDIYAYEAKQYTMDILASNSIIILVCLTGLIGTCFAKRSVLIVYEVALILIFSIKFISLPFSTSSAFDEDFNQLVIINNLSLLFLFFMIIAVTYLVQYIGLQRKEAERRAQEEMVIEYKVPIHF